MMMDAAAQNDIWNPGIIIWAGLDKSIIIAASRSALSAKLRRPMMYPMATAVAIITARVTDGDSPVSVAYIHNIRIDAAMRNLRRPKMLSGESSNRMIAAIMPAWSPLNASMWATPALENAERVSWSRVEVSPIMAAFRNS